MIDDRFLAIPVSPGRWVHVGAGFPLTPGEWTQLLRTLDAMRPGLVSPDGHGETEARGAGTAATGSER